MPVIIVADNVVAGGISASYAACGDLLIFEGKKTKWMFAGPRVAANVEKGNLPEKFLEAEWCINHGIGDFIIENRRDTRQKLISLLSILLKKNYAINSEINETPENFSTLTKTAS